MLMTIVSDDETSLHLIYLFSEDADDINRFVNKKRVSSS